MTTRKDQLDGQNPPDRLYYATGVFLDAEDMDAEQSYHRSRLARALDYLDGFGTVAGLTVEWAATSDDTSPRPNEEEIRIRPGLAIDALGRLIEVPRTLCLDLRRWWQWQADRAAGRVPVAPEELGSPDDLAVSHRDTFVVVDVFLSFAACERGKTPAFATGPFDATDAVQPSRIRDGFEVQLVIRTERPDVPEPVRPWADVTTTGTTFEDWLTDLRTAILGGWRHGTDVWDGGPPRRAEHREGWDYSAVLLARLRIPAAAPVGDAAPVRTLDGDGRPTPVTVDNHLRSFVYPASALVQWLVHARASRA